MSNGGSIPSACTHLLLSSLLNISGEKRIYIHCNLCIANKCNHETRKSQRERDTHRLPQTSNNKLGSSICQQ